MNKILIASVLGAFVCVLWGAVSWMGLSWHGSVLRDFHDEAAVSAALNANAGDELKRHGEPGGVFILPSNALSGNPAPPPTETALMKSSTARKPVDNSMFVFAVVRPGPHSMNFGINMAWLFARSFAACLIISLMLSWTMRLDYLQRLIFCVLGGVFSGLVADAPLMVWFKMPLRYSITNFADHLCEWTLAGLAIAAFVEGRDVWEKIVEMRVFDPEFGACRARFCVMKLLSFVMAFFAVFARGAENPAVDAVNHLGLASLRLTHGNALVSPWSLQQSLVMIYAGTHGQTQEEMAAALGYRGEAPALHAAFKELRDSVRTTAPSLNDLKPLRSANRLYGAHQVKFRPDWLQLMRESYDAEPETVNLAQPVESEKIINGWVRRQTEGEIPLVIPPGALRPVNGLSPQLVLVNALYFNMPWDERFTRELTADAPFFSAVGRSKTVPLMFKQHRQRHAHKDGFQIVTVPYAGGSMQFVVILPDRAAALDAVEKALTPELLAQCATLPQTEVRLWLPRLKLEPPARDMREDLQQLGMKTAFSAQADLSGMLEGGNGSQLDEVFHRAFLEMDEDGAKAAAATASIIRPKNGVPHEIPHEKVRADHPFLFLIQHVPSGACLFVGRVVDPAPAAPEKIVPKKKK